MDRTDRRCASGRGHAAPHGRNSDFADAERLLRRFVAGDLRLSYVPDMEQRSWRILARSRVQITRQRVRMRNQIEAFAAGVTDTTALTAQASEHLHATDEQLAEAPNGQLQDDHRFLLRMYLDQVEIARPPDP